MIYIYIYTLYINAYSYKELSVIINIYIKFNLKNYCWLILYGYIFLAVLI